jgi:hypothetical protein
MMTLIDELMMSGELMHIWWRDAWWWFRFDGGPVDDDFRGDGCESEDAMNKMEGCMDGWMNEGTKEWKKEGKEEGRK